MLENVQIAIGDLILAEVRPGFGRVVAPFGRDPVLAVAEARPANH